MKYEKVQEKPFKTMLFTIHIAIYIYVLGFRWYCQLESGELKHPQEELPIPGLAYGLCWMHLAFCTCFIVSSSCFCVNSKKKTYPNYIRKKIIRQNPIQCRDLKRWIHVSSHYTGEKHISDNFVCLFVLVFNILSKGVHVTGLLPHNIASSTTVKTECKNHNGFTMLEKVENVYKVSSGLNWISVLFVYRRPDFLFP